MPDAEYGLVMPFVVCETQGGPLDDRAFVVGYELGHLDAELKTLASYGNDATRPLPIARYVHSVGVPQVDLIAMRHGYVLMATPWDDDPEQWTLAEFVRSDNDEPEGSDR